MMLELINLNYVNTNIEKTQVPKGDFLNIMFVSEVLLWINTTRSALSVQQVWLVRDSFLFFTITPGLRLQFLQQAPALQANPTKRLSAADGL